MKKSILWENPFKKTKSEYEDDIEFLFSVPIFDTLSRKQLVKLQSIIHTRHFPKDDVVFRQGDPGFGLYVIREGTVDVLTERQDLSAHKITTLTVGCFFGEISLLNESPRSATILTTEETVLLGLFKSDLMGLLGSDPKLGFNLILRISQFVAERLRIMTMELERLDNEV